MYLLSNMPNSLFISPTIDVSMYLGIEALPPLEMHSLYAYKTLERRRVVGYKYDVSCR